MVGNILLGIVSLCTFISYFPQAVKLIKTKSAEDLCIESWFLWVTSSMAYTIYAVFISKEIMLIVEAGVELFFCILILFLAIKYKRIEYIKFSDLKK